MTKRNSVDYNARRKKYRQRPEVKAREKAYRQRPEVKARQRIIQKKYSQKPEVKAKAHKKAYWQSPEAKARARERNQSPEAKARARERNRRPEVKAYKKAYIQRPEVKERKNRTTRTHHKSRKYRVMAHYSKIQSNSDVPCCACCGENEFLIFLTIDHITGRKNTDDFTKSGTKLGGNPMYSKLEKRGFPDGYRVLCLNCNCAREHQPGKVCPHQRNKR